MRTIKNSTMMMAVFFCTLVSNQVNATILWERDLICDVNMDSSPLASCINKDADGVIVITKVGPKGTFLSEEGNCILWEIGVDGNIVRQVHLKNTDGNAIRTNAVAAGPGCEMASDNFGNLLTIGIFREQIEEKSISVIAMANPMEPNILKGKLLNVSSIKKIIPSQNDIFFMVGNRSDNGLCLKIDNGGNILREVLFDIGQHEIFSDADLIKSDNINLAIVGLSEKIAGKDINFKNILAIYDPNFQITNSDYFTGGDYISLLPKVCCINNGNIILLYVKKTQT